MDSYSLSPRSLAASFAGVLLLCAARPAAASAARVIGTPPQEALSRAVDPAAEAQHRVRIEGTALLSGGAPARGAVVITDAGGSCTTGEDGSFALELALEPAEQDVELIAVASGPRGTLTARRKLDGLRADPLRHAGVLTLSAAQGCAPSWVSTFGGPPGTNDSITALAVFDDGSGPALYASGEFNSAGGELANGVARWNGRSWSAVGGGTDGYVLALTVFDDGSGPVLVAGGLFQKAGGVPANRIAQWDGLAWSALGGGVNSVVSALTAFDDGSGPALYAGGSFTSAGGQAAGRVARWDGQSWSALGSGTDGSVFALGSFDYGGGAALYAAGDFALAGGQPANNIAKWDGLAWSPLGSGVSGSFGPAVLALAAFDDGSGTELYAGGGLTSAGGLAVNGIARWDGQSWSAVGSGIAGICQALAVFDDGSGAGPALYAGGLFDTAGGVRVRNIARWDGAAWSALAGGVQFFTGIFEEPAVAALAVYDGSSGGGPALAVGGTFDSAGGQGVEHVARWNGLEWSALGKGLNDEVRVLSEFDDGSGSGSALYAGGFFTTAGGKSANYIARWDGQGWSSLATGIGGAVEALAVFDDASGAGPALYAGGFFTTAGGQSAHSIARWDGQGWSALGTGIDGKVLALAVFDDGAGPALYAGGYLGTAGGQPADVAKWDGVGWSSLPALSLGSGVEALAVFDDGTGPALYAGGSFSTAGGQTVHGIARWDGLAWSALAGGVGGGSVGGVVRCLAVFDDGTGPALYAGGEFTIAGGQPASNVARWDGQSWSALGSGIAGGIVPVVLALAVHDDGSGGGPALYAGGFFFTAGGQVANTVAMWDGQSWSSLGSGASGLTFNGNMLHALAGFDDGMGPALYAGGTFEASPGGDAYLARWSCPPVDAAPGCFGNPAVLAAPSSAALGAPFPVSLSSSSIASGLGVLYAGLDGTDPAGCGLLVPGLGELLLSLAPVPAQVGAAGLSAGSVGFALPVPSDPSSVGLELALQGAVLGLFGPGVPLELSNALHVTVTP